DLYRRLTEEDRRVRREELYSKLVSALPKEDETLGGETTTFARLAKTRGGSLRSLLQKLPALTAKVAPCMLMSPTTVASLLSPKPQFDLVIFDEASQMPTAEAIGCLARAKSAVVVGDPNQLPPTSFFASGYAEEDEEEQESVLDELISIGLPQRRLSWHYRSAHESLIAFSNARYYHSDLKTFPSPNGFDSKVSFRYVEDGVYDRGATKRNPIEAQALIDEVIARLSSPELSKKSMGIVTFSSVQRDYLDRLLSKAILARHLEEVAYDREDPIFVKNLENVQGDERDVILFSVCYGPDAFGKVSLNFGPLNQAGGWRRLNVAVTRAREEMIVFSSLRPGMIDLSGTSARGVADLKAFLEFAERGKSEVAVTSGATATRGGIGKFLARELSAFGYECRADVGASSFKIDLAVVDPNRPDRYVLAVLADKKGPVYDAKVLQPFSLKRGDWNVATVYAESFYRSPRKVVRALKELLDRLTGRGNRRVNVLRSRQTYKYAVLPFVQREESYFLDGRNEREILSLLRKIVTREEPVSATIVAKRLMDASSVHTDG
ncbi:MAG: AAA domain-containing protein, partial [Christensenellaceae bacterium]